MTTPKTSADIDFSKTVQLPKTDFPMRGGLPQKEPEILAHWGEIGLWDKLRAQGKGREKFILHDGPPYANGHLHIGHALNKILKDIINRSQQMLGKDANYVPGWDCHGLPIEWKIEERYRAKGMDKDTVPVVEFRQECRDFAQHWLDIQRAEFKRLGVLGDWDRPYTTMAFHAEAKIAGEIGKFLLNGGLYKGSKPVLWSVVEKTALAEAEVEYHEHKSTTIHVAFPVVTPSDPVLAGARIVIWTTTPWTIPGNRAIAASAELDYVVITVAEVAEGARLAVGDRLVVSKLLLSSFLEVAKIADHAVEAELKGAVIAGTVCAHPWRGQSYDFDVRVLLGEFVTAETGTGFVHIAPGHGADDFELGRANGVEIPQTVAEDGSFYDFVPMLGGARVLTPDGKEGDANGRVIKALVEAGALVAKGSLRHSYPHSWRSKAPLIFRNTAQWFISMDTNALRDKALSAIDATRFFPTQGRNRLHAMIAQRPDWCISRQRAWGVPIPVFVHKQTGQPLRDADVVARVVEAFEQEGADAWFSSPASRFLGNQHNPAEYEQVMDVVDVWFDSGSTHAFVLEEREDLQWPASLYLEGSDQHRGWFHSSLLEACGTRGRAPYDAVLTHGFILAEDGRKMSKSLGNIVEPAKVNETLGAEILRLWVVAEDYTTDLKVGEGTLKQMSDYYRRFRNTLRWLLGNLGEDEPAERVPVDQMPELERWVLHRLSELDQVVREAVVIYDFNTVFRELHDFCNVDLSAFYFDIRKDSLYCDRPDALRRRAAVTVCRHVFDCLTAWLAPILCFTTEEAWLGQRRAGDAESVHLRLFPDIPAEWTNQVLAAKWKEIRRIRRVVTGALEVERAEKRIRSSLEAHPVVHVSPKDAELLADVDFADVCITSQITVSSDPAPAGAFQADDTPGVAVVPALAEGRKCARSWRILPEVGSDPEFPDLSLRDADAVRDWLSRNVVA